MLVTLIWCVRYDSSCLTSLVCAQAFTRSLTFVHLPVISLDFCSFFAGIDQTTDPAQGKCHQMNMNDECDGFFYVLYLKHTRLTCRSIDILFVYRHYNTIFVYRAWSLIRVQLYIFTALVLFESVEFICWIYFRWTQKEATARTMCVSVCQRNFVRLTLFIALYPFGYLLSH